MNSPEIQLELEKYRNLILAALDYFIEFPEFLIKTEQFDSVQHYQNLKIQIEEDYKKGRLAKLKKYFDSLIEMPIEGKDLRFNNFIIEKTRYEINIFESYFQRIEKIIAKGKITSDNQFYELMSFLDQLCQAQPTNDAKIEEINILIREYENRKSTKLKKPIA